VIELNSSSGHYPESYQAGKRRQRFQDTQL
jgi:hypothetical protein